MNSRINSGNKLGKTNIQIYPLEAYSYNVKRKDMNKKWKRIEVQNIFEIYKFNKIDNIQFSQ